MPIILVTKKFKKMKFKTPWNAHEFPKTYPKVSSISCTVPDQTLTVRELLDRQSRGLSLSGVKVPIYDGEDHDLPDPRTLDLAEREEMIRQAQSEIDEIKSRQQKKPKYIQTEIPPANEDPKE